MNREPEIIKVEQIADIIHERFSDQKTVTCYIGSNAATPTASIEALSDTIRSRNPKLPFMKMVHLLLQGPVPYVAEGLQDRVMTYSIFSTGDVRKAANQGRAYYLPCTLANLDSLIGKNRAYEPDVVLVKVRQNELTGEYSLGLSVEALHTAIDHAEIVIAELDRGMPFTQGQRVWSTPNPLIISSMKMSNRSMSSRHLNLKTYPEKNRESVSSLLKIL